MLQSWTKNVKNFALSYPQDFHPADLVPQWPLPPPHPCQCCSVRGRNDPAGLQHCFGDEGESICDCQCFWELFLEIRHDNVHFLIIFVQVCRCLRLSPFNLNRNISALKVLLCCKRSWMWAKQVFRYDDVSYERELRCEVGGGVKHANLILSTTVLVGRW